MGKGSQGWWCPAWSLGSGRQAEMETEREEEGQKGQEEVSVPGAPTM